MRAVMREVLLSRGVLGSGNYFARYSWPVEFVVRALKDIGWTGFSVGRRHGAADRTWGRASTIRPTWLAGTSGNAGSPPASMLARMNFASSLAGNQKFKLEGPSAPRSRAPRRRALLAYVLDGLPAPDFDSAVRSEMLNYLRATGAWTGSTPQLQDKMAGLVPSRGRDRAEYQFV